jgi:hypothetical protein
MKTSDVGLGVCFGVHRRHALQSRHNAKKNKLFANSLLAVTVMGASLLLPGQAQAALLLGTLNFNGNAAISNGLIDFETASGGPTGAVTFTSSTGDFSLYGGSTGVLKDITNVAFPIPPGSGTLADFILATLFPSNIHFTMTILQTGIYPTAGCSDNPPAAGQTCTVGAGMTANTPYNLLNLTAASSQVSFVVTGTETDGVSTTPFLGTFTETFSGSPFQSLVATIQANGTITTAFAGSITTVAPEPGSLPMLAGGVFIFGLAFAHAKVRRVRS